jgi:opacity protein-like surface antigen
MVVMMVGTVALCASAADAQTLPGPIASVSFSADPDIRWSVAGSLGYKFNRMMTLGIELTWNSLKYAPADDVSPYATVTFTNPGRDVVSFTTNARIEIPTRSRITPYGVVGGGISSDRTRYSLSIAYTAPTAGSSASPRIETRPETVASSTYMTFVLGGGAGVAIKKRLSIDLDVRGFYFRGYSDFGLARIAAGATVRF